jgi:hypothetical protein
MPAKINCASVWVNHIIGLMIRFFVILIDLLILYIYLGYKMVLSHGPRLKLKYFNKES